MWFGVSGFVINKEVIIVTYTFVLCCILLVLRDGYDSWEDVRYSSGGVVFLSAVLGGVGSEGGE